MTPADAAPAVKPREAVRVRTAPVEQREMVRTLSTTTTVMSEREVELVPRSSGLVTRVAVEEGDWVEAGALLAEFDRQSTQSAIESARIALLEVEDAAKKAQFALPEAQNKLATAKLKWEQATREHDRNQKAGMISAQALDNLAVVRDTAKSEYDGALLAVERARAEIQALGTQKAKAEVALQLAELDDSYMLLTAPFAGTIAERGLKVGDTAGRVRNAVGQITPAFLLTDTRSLRAVVHRPQRELTMFLAAQEAAGRGVQQNGDGAPLEIRATAEALPGRTFRGEIKLVSPTIDPTSGSFRVTVKLPPTEPGEAGLLPGMLVRLEIVTERHPDALVVPKRALRREGGAEFVFTVVANHAHRVEVKEGFPEEDDTEVVPIVAGDLAVGARVIVVGNREIEDGAEVLEEAPPTAPPVRDPTAPDPTPPDPTASESTPSEDSKG
jgi:membrane fusion protein (multidrug efflux system)